MIKQLAIYLGILMGFVSAGSVVAQAGQVYKDKPACEKACKSNSCSEIKSGDSAGQWHCKS